MKEKVVLAIAPISLTGLRSIEVLKKRGWSVYGAGLGEMSAGELGLEEYWRIDITDYISCRDVLRKYKGKYVINFAGATAVDEIEETRPLEVSNEAKLADNPAFRINVQGTRRLIESCTDEGKFPVFVSTGWVYDGQNGPNGETDPIGSDVNKVSWYAWTKILAERAVAESKQDNLTIRIDFPFGRDYKLKNDIAHTFLSVYDKYKKGEIPAMYPVFADQMITPTFLDDIGGAIEFLIDKNQQGIFNIVSPKRVSLWAFVCELLRVARNAERPEAIVLKGSLKEYIEKNPSYSKRPVNGGLKADKIINLGYAPLDWKQAIWETWGKVQNG